MRLYYGPPDGWTGIRVSWSAGDADYFNSRFPCSGVRGPGWAGFSPENGDLTDIGDGLGDGDGWDAFLDDCLAFALDRLPAYKGPKFPGPATAQIPGRVVARRIASYRGLIFREPVIFRACKLAPTRGEVIAIFPCLPADETGALAVDYAHVGQHGACSRAVVGVTRPASLRESAELRLELALLGHGLQPVKRWSAEFDMERRLLAAQIAAQTA